MAFIVARKPGGVLNWSTFEKLVGSIIRTRNLGVNRQIRAMSKQEARDLQSLVFELRGQMKDGGLPSDTGFIHRRKRVHVGPATQQEFRSFGAAILRRHVQQRSAPKCQSA